MRWRSQLGEMWGNGVGVDMHATISGWGINGGRSEFSENCMTLVGGSASCKCIMALFGSVLREEYRADADRDLDLCSITDLQATAEIVDAVHGFQVVESKGNQMLEDVFSAHNPEVALASDVRV